MADPAAAHARLVRLLLRAAALPDVADPGPRPLLRRHPAGHRAPAVHYDRLPGAAAADSAGGHVDQRHDASARATLENAAPADLRNRAAGNLALLLAGQGRRARAACLSGNRSGPIGVAAVEDPQAP